MEETAAAVTVVELRVVGERAAAATVVVATAREVSVVVTVAVAVVTEIQSSARAVAQISCPPT